MGGLLDGRAALVTGASSGIGEAVALAMAAAGAKVAVSARRADRLDALVRRIEDVGGVAATFAGDVADEAFATELVEAAAARFGRLDILVNSAGVMPEGGVADADFARWRHVLEVNLLACLYTSRAAAQVMRAQGAGDIINISSTAGRRATGLFAAYSTSKFGLTAMTEGLRQEVGGHGVRVCILEPGATDTTLFESIVDPELRRNVQHLAQREGVLKPADVADAVLFVVGLPPRANVSELLIRPTIDTAPL
jgi:NADP-dependent 3-hydroxy acid dehydrogenase YdfG